ncbi:MAG: prepilin-type N-terminal cleavage/methylation domain-containing protein [Desulfobacterales bacterium]|nr:prepilin-type N-terminal cleavage/methylation domain-containing protein [Desulfobacterales bacterium]
MRRDFFERVATDRSTDRNGFALIEVLMAMVIFTVGILALTGLQITTISGNAEARMQTEATAIGARVVERLRSLPFDHDDLVPKVHPHSLPASVSRPYTVDWTVRADTPVNGTKTVRVTVTPFNKINGRTVTISTIIAE